MCGPTATNTNGTPMRNIVIAGAGPAGLLLFALLMQRNDELPSPLYNITLVDGRQDLGVLSKDELKKKFRSWMLGLTDHGLNAIRTCKDGLLYEKYCKDVGIEIESLSIHLGSKELKTDAKPENQSVGENFIIDRNFVVAALARYVNDTLEDTSSSSTSSTATYTTLYDHKVMYVDYEHRRVLIRNSKTMEERYLSYDLVVGCDGVRSTVREALVKRHSTFEMDVGDIFQQFKAVHVDTPLKLEQTSMHILPDCFPSMIGLGLPETGGKLNITIGAPRHVFDIVPEELKSYDSTVVADYFKTNFKAFELVDYDDFATQWVSQPWNRTGQVHCNMYHSTDINVVIMGDAAHATSPSIGMGMNTALRDAQVFYELLVQHKDDLDSVLPEFSAVRVPEGNSLTDLAMHLSCLDPKVQFRETIHTIVRTMAQTKLPKWMGILDHPQTMIGRTMYKLSDVYNQAKLLGILDNHRVRNDRIRQIYFEQTNGMVTSKTQTKLDTQGWKQTILWSAVLVPLVGAALSRLWTMNCNP